MPRRLGLWPVVVAVTLLTGACSSGCQVAALPPLPDPYYQAPVVPKPKSRGIYKVGEPYRIAGIVYTPHVDYGYDREGVASWYGHPFHGRRTANGERYDQEELTAAHQTLPLPSVVRVTNLENGRTLVLRINDRGPFVQGRILDVSRKAAKLLRFRAKGTTKVRVQVLEKESRQAAIEAGG
jgi:rare lipoprotein A